VVLWSRRSDELRDDALLSAIAVDDNEAMAVLVRRHQRRVFGLAASIVRDRTLAEDIAQQAFERAWRHAGSFDPRRAAVSTWLLTITRNLAIDAIRASRADPVDPHILHGWLPDDHEADPALAATQRSEVDEIASELALLPVEQRRAVVLAVMGGRTAVEIGELEGIPVGTAKTRLRLGMAKLRSVLVTTGGAADGA
jgi:RNA polymerase sigma factor (sigma-70 family)